MPQIKEDAPGLKASQYRDQCKKVRRPASTAAHPQCAEPQNAFLSACVFIFIAQHSIVLQAVCVS